VAVERRYSLPAAGVGRAWFCYVRTPAWAGK